MIEREVYSSLRAHLKAKQITVLIGARQVGKTTLAKKLMAEEINDNRPTLFLNLDNEADSRHLESQGKLLQKIRLEFGEQSGTVFIDEIQRKENAGIFLKGIYDQELPYKFVVTGSGSMDLKASITESLAGRKRIFHIPTVSFREFFNFRTKNRYRGKETDYATIEPESMNLLLLEYLSFGGYPEVILAASEQDKRLIIKELFEAYVEKDIVGLLNINDRAGFVLMLRLLADRQGSSINYTKLANEVGISVNTLKNYLYYAKETYIIEELPPYYNNSSKEFTKAPEFYFADIGLKNYALGQFSLLTDSGRRLGPDFEQFIFRQLSSIGKANGWPLHYYRTRDGAEVDFILNQITKVYPFEVKSTKRLKAKVPRPIEKFSSRYSIDRAFVISRDQEETTVKINETDFHLQPWWRLTFGEVF